MALIVAFCVSTPSASFSANKDINDVLFRGESTSMGMKIERVYTQKGAFLVSTTGARYEYVPGELKVYQGLNQEKRLLATIIFDCNSSFEKSQDTNDHALFWSKEFNVGIYGDSTCIIAPKMDLVMKCGGHFKPDYEGRYNGELLLIDELGGVEIYPQRYETGYEVQKIELKKKDWVASYKLKAGERVMLAAFPGRPFNWEKSFKSNVVTTSGFYENNSFGQKFGMMPPDPILEDWSKNFHIITMFARGTYSNSDYAGPYTVVNEPEYRRFVNSAHRYNMKVLSYVSFFYFNRKFKKNKELLFEQISNLKNKFGVDGVYIDGAFVDIHDAFRVHKFEDKIATWEMLRRLRELFGGDGVIMLHGTHQGSPVGTAPNIDGLCDITLNGEGISFQSFDEPYIRYHVRKYGISNAVAMWKTGKHPTSISYDQIIDFILSINGRERWGAYPWWNEKNSPVSKKKEKFYFWPVDYKKAKYDYYLSKLAVKRNEYLKTIEKLHK